jgi:DUF1365 family protein
MMSGNLIAASPTASALYAGTVVHARLRPTKHRLRYRIFTLLLDLDELPHLGLRWFSHNRFNLFSFHDRDHGDGTPTPLRDQIGAHLRAAGYPDDGGPVRLLSMPRLFGYAFNPLSVYFCHRRDGSLLAVLHEVNNTFGERHCYLLPVEDQGDDVIRQSCQKCFYVSPFMDMAMTYNFRITPPAARVAVAIETSDADGPMLEAVFDGSRQPLTDRTLLRALLAYPLLTLKVVAGIHWEALKLWRKGMRLRPRPQPPRDLVTAIAPRIANLGNASPNLGNAIPNLGNAVQ